jgi:hypothetical protein
MTANILPKPVVAGHIAPAHVAETASMAVVTLLLSWLAATQLLVVAGWWFGIVAYTPLAWLSFALACALSGFAAGPDACRRWAGPVPALALLAVGACIGLALLSHDFSADGQSYHQQAILALAQGWNPVRTPDYAGPYTLWLSHYPKGAWIVAASLLSLTGQIEAGKGIAYLLMLCVALVAYQVLRELRPQHPRTAWLLALLLAFNPIACYQIQTYYVDSQLASLLSLFVLLCHRTLRTASPLAALALVTVCVLGINLKFSVLPFFVVIGAVALLAGWRYERNAAGWVSLRRTLFGGLVAAMLVGFHPYVTNWMSKGHPFYPLAGSGAVDILVGHVEADFLRRNRIEKLGLSLLSASEPRMAKVLPAEEKQFRLKWPFVVQPAELKAFYLYTDVRVGGFGPWMGGALLLLLTAAALAVIERRSVPPTQRFAVGLSAGVLMSILIMPEAWWARYAPQLWLLAVLGAGLLATRVPRRAGSALATAALLAFSVDVLLVAIPALANRIATELDYRAQTASLKVIAEAGIPAQIAIREDSTRYRLQHEGVTVEEVREANCQGLSDHLIATDSPLCVPAGAMRAYRRGSAWLAAALGRAE